MNFAYIVESLLFDATIPSIPCQLDQKWSDFETELIKFKTEFSQTRAKLAQLTHTLQSKRDEIHIVKMVLDNVSSDGLKEKLSDLIDKHESEEGISTLTLQCGEAAGQVEAMKKILMDTNSERYARFTCFVCMDRLVDLFIEPCGHVICDGCWTRTQNKDSCPGCRTACIGAKRIFSMT